MGPFVAIVKITCDALIIIGLLCRMLSHRGAVFAGERRLAHPARFERAASTFGGWRSIQLSYGCITAGH